MRRWYEEENMVHLGGTELNVYRAYGSDAKKWGTQMLVHHWQWREVVDRLRGTSP